MSLSLDPPVLWATFLLVSLLMLLLGIDRKRLSWRTVECPVCHRPRRSCTCQWL